MCIQTVVGYVSIHLVNFGYYYVYKVLCSQLATLVVAPFVPAVGIKILGGIVVVFSRLLCG